MIDFEKVPALLPQAVKKGDFDQALELIFNEIDPKNEHDLGGEAGVWFGGACFEYVAPADNGLACETMSIAWPHLSEIERLAYLARFFGDQYKMRLFAGVL